MSDNCDTKNKDCDECQKTLKDHLRNCAGYGNNPPLIEKCEDLPGGCSKGKPECCPAPPPPCPPPCPPKCEVPPTTCFTCPASDCGKQDCSPPPKCCPPQPTKVVQCPIKNDNNCDTKPLSMNKKDKC